MNILKYIFTKKEKPNYVIVTISNDIKGHAVCDISYLSMLSDITDADYDLIVKNVNTAIAYSNVLKYKKSCKIEIDKDNYTCDIVDYMDKDN